MHRFFAFGLLAPLALAGGTAIGKGAVKRDLSAAFGDAVCTGGLSTNPSQAWERKVFDAQLEGRLVSPLGGLRLSSEQMEHKAKALAHTRGAGGYAYGMCKDGSGWAVAMPAPEPLLADASHRIKIPLVALQQRCESYRVDFAAKDHGAPKEMAIEAGGISTKNLGDGVLSVTCQPKTPRWRGPVLWFLYPTGLGPDQIVPEAEVFAEAPAMPVHDQLAAWVNRIRRREGLKALEFKAELAEQAGLLAIDGGLSHDRVLLKKTASLLDETAKIHLIGEDRVRAKDAASMAWLWWNSPRHRQLLLNTDATVGGLASRAVGDEKLAVLAVGSAPSAKTAKANAARPKAQKR